MRFAIKTAMQQTTWPELLTVWREADDIELFESAWSFDHFYPIFTDPFGRCLESWVTLSALAHATRRLRIGCLVNGMPHRHPAVLANMAGTLDVISGGRFELGLGAGWNSQELDAYGIELGSVRERVERFAEAVEVVIRLLSDETTTFVGKYYRLTDARCEPKGLQRPHLPICIGAAGERRMIPLAARWAQHWNCLAQDAADYRHKRAIFEESCERIGRESRSVTCSTQVHVGRLDLQDVVNQVVAFAEAGADLIVLYLLPPLDPAILCPLAESLAVMASADNGYAR